MRKTSVVATIVMTFLAFSLLPSTALADETVVDVKVASSGDIIADIYLSGDMVDATIQGVELEELEDMVDTLEKRTDLNRKKIQKLNKAVNWVKSYADNIRSRQIALENFTQRTRMMVVQNENRIQMVHKNTIFNYNQHKALENEVQIFENYVENQIGHLSRFSDNNRMMIQQNENRIEMVLNNTKYNKQQHEQLEKWTEDTFDEIFGKHSRLKGDVAVLTENFVEHRVYFRENFVPELEKEFNSVWNELSTHWRKLENHSEKLENQQDEHTELEFRYEHSETIEKIHENYQQERIRELENKVRDFERKQEWLFSGLIITASALAVFCAYSWDIGRERRDTIESLKEQDKGE